jgi:hypothetical protein
VTNISELSVEILRGINQENKNYFITTPLTSNFTSGINGSFINTLIVRLSFPSFPNESNSTCTIPVSPGAISLFVALALIQPHVDLTLRMMKRLYSII